MTSSSTESSTISRPNLLEKVGDIAGHHNKHKLKKKHKRHNHQAGLLTDLFPLLKKPLTNVNNNILNTVIKTSVNPKNGGFRTLVSHSWSKSKHPFNIDVPDVKQHRHHHHHHHDNKRQGQPIVQTVIGKEHHSHKVQNLNKAVAQTAKFINHKRRKFQPTVTESSIGGYYHPNHINDIGNSPSHIVITPEDNHVIISPIHLKNENWHSARSRSWTGFNDHLSYNQFSAYNHISPLSSSFHTLLNINL